MGIQYTGVFEMLGNGFGLGILFGMGALAVLWGVLYVLDRLFPEKKDEEAHMMRLLESNVKALPKARAEHHRKAA